MEEKKSNGYYGSGNNGVYESESSGKFNRFMEGIESEGVLREKTNKISQSNSGVMRKSLINPNNSTSNKDQCVTVKNSDSRQNIKTKFL